MKIDSFYKQVRGHIGSFLIPPTEGSCTPEAPRPTRTEAGYEIRGHVSMYILSFSHFD